MESIKAVFFKPDPAAQASSRRIAPFLPSADHTTADEEMQWHYP
jgi:hypothetical protein